MRDDQWLEAYKAGHADAQAEIVKFLRLAEKTRRRITNFEDIAFVIERGDYLK